MALITVLTALPCVATELTIVTSEDAVFRGGASSGSTFAGAALEINALNNGLGGDTSNSAKSWLKFDLAGLASVVALSDAALEIEPGTATGAPVSVYGLIGNDNWNDISTTWNTAPGNDLSSAVHVLPGKVFGGVPLGSFTHSSGINTFTSSLLSDYIDSERVINGGDGTATIILTGSLPIVGGSHGYFKSIESDPGEEARLSLSISPPVELRINRFSGLTQIVGVNTPQGFNIDGYSIHSGTALALDPIGWSSLQDQGELGWEEVPPGGGVNPKSTLTELNLTGFKQVADGQQISLGQAYDPSSGFEDMTFSYTLQGDPNSYTGDIVFTSDGGLYARVNKLTGRITIQNPAQIDIDIDAYGILSTAGLLNPVTWNSLHDQNELGWVESNPSANRLLELNLLASTVVPAGEAIDLGVAYTGGLNGLEDLSFVFSINSGPTISSLVNYFISTGILGDYDNSGAVGQSDYDLWRASFGSTTQLSADGNGNGVIDAADYAIWRDNLVATGSESVSAATSVPEPNSAAAALIVVFLIGWLTRHRTTLANWPRCYASPGVHLPRSPQ